MKLLKYQESALKKHQRSFENNFKDFPIIQFKLFKFIESHHLLIHLIRPLTIRSFETKWNMLPVFTFFIGSIPDLYHVASAE